MAVDSLELRPRTAVGIFDAAVRVCATRPGVWSLTLPAGAALTAAVFWLVDCAQRDEGLGLPVLAMTLAWIFRALSQGATCHWLEQELLSNSPAPVEQSARAALAHLPSLVIAAALSGALNLIIILLSGGLGWILLSAHLVAYAVAMKSLGSPLGIYGTSSRLLGPARPQAFLVRLCGLSQLLLWVNLHVGVNLLLSVVAQQLLGLEVTWLVRFCSLDNPTWVATVLAVGFALFEPLRAACATLLLIDGRVRAEGLDLIAQLEQLPRRKGSAAAAAVVALGLALWPAGVQADDGWTGVFTPGAEERAKEESSSQTSERFAGLVEDCELSQTISHDELQRFDALAHQQPQAALRLLRALEALAYDGEDCEGARAQFERSRALLAGTEETGQSPAALRAQAKEILAAPEFRASPPKAAPTAKEPDSEPPGFFKQLIDRFLAWLRELLRARPEPVERSVGVPSPLGLGSAVLWGSVLLAVALLAYTVLQARLSRASPAVEAQVSALAGADPEAAGALARAPEGWAELADAHAARGEFRLAIRTLYLALLSRLHRDGAIDYDPHKSNWDYFRHFKGPAGALPTFRELTRRFDFAWYGRQDSDGRAWQGFRQLSAGLLAAPSDGEVSRSA